MKNKKKFMININLVLVEGKIKEILIAEITRKTYQPLISTFGNSLLRICILDHTLQLAKVILVLLKCKKKLVL